MEIYILPLVMVVVEMMYQTMRRIPCRSLGKMIRINVDDTLTPPFYQVPASNPYVGDASFDSRIYNLGLRNPFRWSFDRANGNMWIGDVGQGSQRRN